MLHVQNVGITRTILTKVVVLFICYHILSVWLPEECEVCQPNVSVIKISNMPQTQMGTRDNQTITRDASVTNARLYSRDPYTWIWSSY